MASYQGKSKRIKNALIQVLQRLTYDAGSGPEPLFTSVAGDTSTEFEGYPSARVLPGTYTDTKGAVGVNDRTLSLIIFVQLPLEEKPITEAATYDYMYDLTDSMLDQLDEADFQGTLNTIDSTIHSYLMNTTRGDWIVSGSKGATMLTVKINVDISYSKDL